MALSKLGRKLVCVVSDVEVDGDGLIVRFTAKRGHPTEIEDRIPLTPRGEMAAVYGVGRLLRILRAGRVHTVGPLRLERQSEARREASRALQGCRRSPARGAPH